MGQCEISRIIVWYKMPQTGNSYNFLKMVEHISRYFGKVFVMGSAEGTVDLACGRKDISFATVCSFMPFEFEVILAYCSVCSYVHVEARVQCYEPST